MYHDGSSEKLTQPCPPLFFSIYILKSNYYQCVGYAWNQPDENWVFFELDESGDCFFFESFASVFSAK